MLRWLLPLFLGGSLAALAQPPPGFHFDVRPFASALDFARSHGIPVDRPTVPDPAKPAAPGDRVVYVAALIGGREVREWLIELQRLELTPEQAKRPRDKMGPLYSALGHSFLLESGWAVEQVRIVGPFLDPAYVFSASGEKPQPVRERETRILVHQGFLDFGLDRAAGFFGRLGARQAADPESVRPLAWRNHPFSAQEVAAAQAAALRSHVSDQEDRIGCEVVPALAEFFNIAQKTPGLEEILRQVLTLPSLFSLATHGGVSEVGINLAPQQARKLQDRGEFIPTPIYALAFELTLNGQPSLQCEIDVTDPRAPLTNCAGVIGVAAGPPPGKKGGIFALRLVGAQAGG